jgi:hypothetical protein
MYKLYWAQGSGVYVVKTTGTPSPRIVSCAAPTRVFARRPRISRGRNSIADYDCGSAWIYGVTPSSSSDMLQGKESLG